MPYTSRGTHDTLEIVNHEAEGLHAGRSSGRREPSLSLSQASERLNRTLDEVSDLIEDGDLRFEPTTDIHSIRVPVSAITEFLAHHSR